MKRFQFVQSNAEIVSQGGLSLVGQAIKRYTSLSSELDKSVALRHGTAHSDVMKSYLGLLSIGKNDFEAINSIDSERYFMTAMELNAIPGEATLRQRMDQQATRFLPILERASIDFLSSIQPELTPVFTGHLPLDADVTPLDNSGSRKEGVSRTYKGHDGYAPMAVYLGQEGYCLRFELREGKQHCQKGTPELLARALRDARRITDQALLLRLDGGNDAIENVDVVLEHRQQQTESQGAVDFIIKWNPRREDKDAWLKAAQQHGAWSYPREGKRTALFSETVVRQWRGYEYTLRRVLRVTERTIDKHGQSLLIPDIELDGWWTSLEHKEEDIIRLYADHGTSEQFHSEFKTDLDIEQLPSGKFATNALVLASSVLTYNILRWIGQNGLVKGSSKRHPAKRRRIKTVMQELMYLAARVCQSARRIQLAFGRGCKTFGVMASLYQRLAYG